MILLAILMSAALLAGLLWLISHWDEHSEGESASTPGVRGVSQSSLGVDPKPSRLASTNPSVSRGGRHSDSLRPIPLQWVPANTPIDIDGRSIAGGMVYVGRGAATAGGHQTEPAMIDPSLPVDWHVPDFAGSGMTYWPSYASISQACRAAYLSWLDSDRADPEAYIGYVFLYFYGLERRVLLDAKLDGRHPDMPIMATEVKRLLAVYGSNGSFRSYASSFLEMIEAVSMVEVPLLPPDSASLATNWEVPLGVRMGLGHFVAGKRPIPAEWALALLRTHPEGNLRIPAARCMTEFDELFQRKYQSKFNDGMVVRPPKNVITISYRPASSGFGGRVYNAGVGDWPDITKLASPIKQLRDLGAECTDALDAYSRYLGRYPDAAGTAAAVGLLPIELLETHGGELITELRAWGGQILAGGRPVAISIDDLVTHWAPGRTEQLSKSDAVSMASLLGKLGLGIEPDVRFGGATPKSGSVAVVFPLPIGPTTAPSPQYSAAATLVHLCAVVASSDGSVTEGERLHLAAHLEDVLGLDVAERARLEARLAWMVTVGAGLGGLKKRVDCLNPDQRTAVGRFLVDIAAIDGSITPDEITTLTKLYRLLGLDEGEVYRAIHALGIDDTGPVTVRSPDSAEPRWAIPALRHEPGTMVRLDPDKVRARLADTATVSALLADIFTDDSDLAAPSSSSTRTMIATPPAETDRAQLVAGLDATHSGLVRRLCGRPKWSRADAEDLANELGLPLLDGAIDRINEAVIGVCGEPLIDGDDPLEINDYAAKGVH